MTEKEIINKLATEMECQPHSKDTIRMYITMAFTAGFEKGKLYQGDPVFSINNKGDKIELYENIKHASEETGIRPCDITHAININRRAGGKYWEYANK